MKQGLVESLKRFANVDFIPYLPVILKYFLRFEMSLSQFSVRFNLLKVWTFKIFTRNTHNIRRQHPAVTMLYQVYVNSYVTSERQTFVDVITSSKVALNEWKETGSARYFTTKETIFMASMMRRYITVYNYYLRV